MPMTTATSRQVFVNEEFNNQYKADLEKAVLAKINIGDRVSGIDVDTKSMLDSVMSVVKCDRTSTAFKKHAARYLLDIWKTKRDQDRNNVALPDIAFSLSRKERFNNHSRVSWTVAEHSILCAYLMILNENADIGPKPNRHGEDLFNTISSLNQPAAHYIFNVIQPLALVNAALTHDLSEAYVSDIPTPVKLYLGGIKDLESSFDELYIQPTFVDYSAISALASIVDGTPQQDDTSSLVKECDYIAAAVEILFFNPAWGFDKGYFFNNTKFKKAIKTFDKFERAVKSYVSTVGHEISIKDAIYQVSFNGVMEWLSEVVDLCSLVSHFNEDHFDDLGKFTYSSKRRQTSWDHNSFRLWVDDEGCSAVKRNSNATDLYNKGLSLQIGSTGYSMFKQPQNKVDLNNRRLLKQNECVQCLKHGNGNTHGNDFPKLVAITTDVINGLFLIICEGFKHMKSTVYQDSRANSYTPPPSLEDFLFCHDFPGQPRTDKLQKVLVQTDVDYSTDFFTDFYHRLKRVNLGDLQQQRSDLHGS